MTVLSYRLCDVFTDRPLAGNALAVFTDAEQLDAATRHGSMLTAAPARKRPENCTGKAQAADSGGRLRG